MKQVSDMCKECSVVLKRLNVVIGDGVPIAVVEPVPREMPVTNTVENQENSTEKNGIFFKLLSIFV